MFHIMSSIQQAPVGLAAALAIFCASSASAETFKVDPVHSTIIFTAKHMQVGNAYGRFNEPTGAVTIDEADAAKSSIDITVKAENLDTANGKRDEHLKGPDFFNVKQFPEIKFKSTSVKKTGDKQYDVTGDLTLHGVTKPVSAKLNYSGTAKNPKGGTIGAGEARLTIKRSDFGMNFMMGPIGDDISIIVSLEGLQE